MYFKLTVDINEQVIDVFFDREPPTNGGMIGQSDSECEVEWARDGTALIRSLRIKDHNKAALLLDWIDEHIVRALGENCDYERNAFE